MQDTAAIASSSRDRQLLATLRALRNGDFSARLPIGSTEVDAEIAEAFNDIVSFGERITGEFVQLAQTAGKSDATRPRAQLAANLTTQVRAIADVSEAHLYVASFQPKVTRLARTLCKSR